MRHLKEIRETDAGQIKEQEWPKIPRRYVFKAVKVFFKASSFLNISYLTDSYICFTLKMEAVPKNTIFGLKMMVKSGLEKFILKSLHARR